MLDKHSRTRWKITWQKFETLKRGRRRGVGLHSKKFFQQLNYFGITNYKWKIDTSAISFEDLKNELFSDAMFGLRKSTELEVPPCPPTAEEIIEDLEKAGPDDVVFTTEINATDLDPLPNTFNLTKRFQVCVFCLFSVFMFRKT